MQTSIKRTYYRKNPERELISTQRTEGRNTDKQIDEQTTMTKSHLVGNLLQYTSHALRDMCESGYFCTNEDRI